MAKFNSDWVERNVYYDETYNAEEKCPHFKAYERPVIVCLCGSTRFKDAFVKAQAEETLAGKIVLTVGLFGHSEGIDMTGPVKAALDVLHLRKVDLADEVLILNCPVQVCPECKQVASSVRGRDCDTCWSIISGRLKVTPTPYVGESTRRELEYARKHGKTVRFLNPPVESEGG